MTVQWTLLHSGSPLQVNDSFIALPNPSGWRRGGWHGGKRTFLCLRSQNNTKLNFAAEKKESFSTPQQQRRAFSYQTTISGWHSSLWRRKGYGAISAPLDSPSNPVQGFIYYVCVRRATIILVLLQWATIVVGSAGTDCFMIVVNCCCVPKMFLRR